MEIVAPYWEQFTGWLLSVDPLYLAAGGGGLLLLAAIGVAIRINRSGAPRTGGPRIQIASFQLAPLGRDAFLKLSNAGEPATLSTARILGRNDVLIKNTVAGQQIPSGGSYSLLLEATGNQRLQANFLVVLVYVDDQRRAYEQTFTLNPPGTQKIKRTKIRK
jgi:hypothetical protein